MNKQYSIKDHLGNVRVTFADVKVPANGLLQDFVLETQSVSTYYPFGWEIKPLSWAFDTYRFGYNNKEKDGDIGDWIDYGERMYLPKIARFPMPDPIIVYEKKYPELSTYQYASNTPIWAVDLDGLEWVVHIRSSTISKKIKKAFSENDVNEVVRIASHLLYIDNKFKSESQQYLKESTDMGYFNPDYKVVQIINLLEYTYKDKESEDYNLKRLQSYKYLDKNVCLALDCKQLSVFISEWDPENGNNQTFKNTELLTRFKMDNNFIKLIPNFVIEENSIKNKDGKVLYKLKPGKSGEEKYWEYVKKIEKESTLKDKMGKNNGEGQLIESGTIR